MKKPELKWGPAFQIQPRDKIISSDAVLNGTRAFKPTYESDPKSWMSMLLSDEYMRRWFTERKVYEKNVYIKQQLALEEVKIKRRFVQMMMPKKHPIDQLPPVPKKSKQTAGSSCDVVYNSDVARNGTISSPSYPAPYPSRTTCRYEFQGRGKERVQIVFHDFNLYHPKDDSKDCENHDSLMAYVHIDGRMEKIDSFCGATLPKPVMSNGPRLKLEFQSLLASRYSRGFKASFSFIENYGIKSGKQLAEFPCAFVFNSNDTRTGSFHSPNYPGFYPRDTECHYFFHGNLLEKVHLHFSYFDVEGVLPCEAISASDYVEFSNFMARDRKYNRHCGQLKEFDMESDRKFFRVTFRSNDRLDGTGFNATYRFLDEVETYTSKVDSTVGVSPKLCTFRSVLLAMVLLVTFFT